MSITSKYYGRTKAGSEIYQYTLENASGVKVCVIEYGCVITNIWVPDSSGVLRDVVQMCIRDRFNSSSQNSA